MAECGTYAGLSAHKRRGEPADEDCLRAGREYRRQRKTPQEREVARIHRRAYWRALSRLRDEHRGRFAQFLHEELGRSRAEARLAEADAAGADDSWWEEPGG